MEEEEDDFQVKLNQIAYAMKEGCGSPFCTNKFCKSNPSHDNYEINDEQMVTYAIDDSYKPCAKYIKPSDVDKIDNKFFDFANLIDYINKTSLESSFRDFSKTNGENLYKYDNFDYESCYRFMNISWQKNFLMSF